MYALPEGHELGGLQYVLYVGMSGSLVTLVLMIVSVYSQRKTKAIEQGRDRGFY